MTARAIMRCACLACATLALASCTTAEAQVYKCPQPDGKVTYSDRPCPAGAKGATTVKVDQNTVKPVDQDDAKRKREEVDKRLSERTQANIDARQARAKALQERHDECRRYAEEIIRQQAWLGAQSAAVRQSAANEIAIQRARMADRDCTFYL